MAGAPLVQPPVGDQQLVGKCILVKYSDPEAVWHCRLVLAHVIAHEFVILTPDGDLYIEDLSGADGDIERWRFYDPAVGPPFGIDPRQIYTFNALPPHDALQRLLEEGATHAAQERLGRGIAPVVAVPAPPPAPAPVQMLPPQGGAPTQAQDALVDVAGQGLRGRASLDFDLHSRAGPDADALRSFGSEDARTLAVSRDIDGNRFKEFRIAANESKGVEFTDWPISGPRTVKHVITAMLDHGGSALGHHQAWRVACRFQPTDAPSMEHESWCKVLQAMLTYDQLDVTNLASAELVVRAIQRIEEKHKFKLSSAEDAGEGALFMGSAGGSRVGSVISPKLTEWIGSEMQKEAMVSKERRKAREERALARKGDKKDENQK